MSRRFAIAVIVSVLLLGGLAFLARTKAVQSWVQEKQAELKFNWIYTKGEGHFSQAPTAFLVECVKGTRPGQALDVAMGQGRNAVYLAKNGWKVTGFDVADEGLRIAEDEAAKAGVDIKCVRVGCEDFEYGHSTWDLIVLAYTPLAFHDPDLISRVKSSVRPGGLVVVETFLEWSPESGKPRIEGLPGPAELRQIFSDFQIIVDREEDDTSEWFIRKTRLIRFCAQKRATVSSDLRSLKRASGAGADRTLPPGQ